MNTQQNQNDIKKKGVQVNPSRDINYDDKEKDFSGEFGEQIESAGQEVNPGELDKTEVDLDRGSKEFSGGDENRGSSDAFDTAVKNAGSKGGAQGYEGNTPDTGLTPDLGGDVSRTSGQAKGSDLGSRQGTFKSGDQNKKQKQDNQLRQ